MKKVAFNVLNAYSAESVRSKENQIFDINDTGRPVLTHAVDRISNRKEKKKYKFRRKVFGIDFHRLRLLLSTQIFSQS